MKEMPKLEKRLLLPPVAESDHSYFAEAEQHPFEADASPSMLHAWWLAECSLLAYADANEAASMASRGGLTMHNEGPVIGLKHGGQAYVLHSSDAVIVAFRGTQVLREVTDWSAMWLRVLRDYLTDGDIRLVPWDGPAGGKVHAGFAASMKELLPGIERQVNSLRTGRSLWLTGHSLGGALATLAGDCLPDVHGVMTFGAPRVGNATFAEALRFPGWRLRNHSDLVPWLPSRVTGYTQAGLGGHFDAAGILHPEGDTWDTLKEGFSTFLPALKASIEALFQGNIVGGITPECLRDHAPLAYAVRTWNALAG